MVLRIKPKYHPLRGSEELMHGPNPKSKKFTISQMLEAASVKDPEAIEYASHTGQMPNVRDLPSVTSDPYKSDVPPEIFPRYVPGSSCPQKGEEHRFFKRGNRDICARCGSSRATRL